jgi:ATP synthase subunit 6
MLNSKLQFNGPLEQFDVYWTFKFFRLFNNIEMGFLINIFVIIFVITFIFFDSNSTISVYLLDNSYSKRFSVARAAFTNLTDKIILQLSNYFATNGPYPFKILLYGVFLEILFLNYLGIFPNNDALTSTFILPFFLAFLFVGIAFLMKYIRYGIQAWSFFVPSAPLLLLGLIVIVELISYSIKLVSLSGRLFANIFSGHVLLAILSGASFVLFGDITTFFLGIFGPTIIVFAVFCLEFFIAFLQGYVFANLGAMYLGDTIVKNEH